MGAGYLARDPERTLSTVLGLGSIHAVAVEMTDRYQLAENLRLVIKYR